MYRNNIVFLNIFQTTKMTKFVLKSGKDLFQVEHSQQETFEDFQAKVFALTDIPPKNLKVLFKAKMIKDQESLLAVPANTQLIVMGTKSGKQLKQTGEIKIETMEIEQPKKIEKFGLVNIGNTCYMNASIQFIKSVPSIDKMIRQIKSVQQNNMSQAIGTTLAGAIREMDIRDVTPKYFVGLFLQAHPEFMPFGTQHDADEFMQMLLQDISATSPQNARVIKQAFEIEMLETIKNTELEAEPPQFKEQRSTKIGCSLGGNEKENKVGTLAEGIKLGLNTKLQKRSEIDDLNHIYESKTEFNSLPSFLIVQMVRFFWKETNDPESAFNKPLAAKICRSISFGAMLDVFEFCTPNLQEKLLKGREAYEQNKKKDEEQFKKEYEEYKKNLGQTNRPETRTLEDFKEIYNKKQVPLTEGLDTGMYELSAVVTHLGNSVDSGHYMAWVKDTEEEWTKYDDDSVYQQPDAKVYHLRGGQPNLEIAYLLMFRKIFTKPLE